MPALPEFQNPPVSEVVLGFEFAPIPDFKLPHYAFFWQKVKEQFPNFEATPPVPPGIERFAEKSPPQDTVNFQFSTDPNEIRGWMVNSTEREVLQLQRNRFLQNWRKVTVDDRYPRYATIRPGFGRNLGFLWQFLDEQGLARPTSGQVEAVYINELERGREWDEPGDLASMFKIIDWPTDMVFLSKPYGARFAFSVEMPDQNGRLHVHAQRARRPRDQEEVVLLRLIARRNTVGVAMEDVLRELDICREWIVRGFTDITRERLHKLWGRLA